MGMFDCMSFLYILLRFFEGFMPKLVINCPEMAKQILVKEFEKFHIRPVSELSIIVTLQKNRFSLVSCNICTIHL